MALAQCYKALFFVPFEHSTMWAICVHKSREKWSMENENTLLAKWNAIFCYENRGCSADAEVTMIEQPTPLSLSRQCELPGLSRAALYDRPVEVSA